VTVSKILTIAVVPSAIVAARFLIPGAWNNGNTWAFAIIGFVATFVGCIAAAIALRRRVSRTPYAAVVAVCVVVAAALLVIFTTMPSWPFAGVGFIVAWVALAASLTIAFTFGASYRYA
jgi:hypothetical protein